MADLDNQTRVFLPGRYNSLKDEQINDLNTGNFMLINRGQKGRAFKLKLAPAVSIVQRAPAAVARTARATGIASGSHPSPPPSRNPGYSGLDTDIEDNQDHDDEEIRFPAEQEFYLGYGGAVSTQSQYGYYLPTDQFGGIMHKQ